MALLYCSVSQSRQAGSQHAHEQDPGQEASEWKVLIVYIYDFPVIYPHVNGLVGHELVPDPVNLQAACSCSYSTHSLSEALDQASAERF